MGVNIGDSGVPQVNQTLAAMKAVAEETSTELRAEQLESQSDLQAALASTVNPLVLAQKAKRKPAEVQKSRIQKMLASGEVNARLLPIEHIKEEAEGFQRRNPELSAEVLVNIRKKITPESTKEEILQAIADSYPDPSLGSEVLDFLLATSDGDLKETLKEVKEEFEQLHGREITAGKNIATQARQAAEKGLGTATSMRDMYRDITGNPREPTALFEELAAKYEYKDLQKVINFLLHSLGADMKSTGPSIPRGKLHTLLTETRSLQAIQGTYNFFRGRMRLINKLCKQEGVQPPPQLTFETMAREFIKLAAERYPSSARVLQMASKLGIDSSER